MNNSSSARENAVYRQSENREESKPEPGPQDSNVLNELIPFSEIQTRSMNEPESNTHSKVFEDVIQAMGAMIEVRDWYTAGHQRKVARISVEIAKKMALPVHQIKGIQLAALIHDIGKLAIPTEILSKPGRLSNSEYELIKTHTSTGFAILRDIDFPWPIAQTVLQHHERMNGSGYPHKLQKYDILLEARILAVADVVEAMASDRPYRAALGINPALEEVTQNKHTLYDGNVVDACLDLFTNKTLIFNLSADGC
jgi:putative two-component system response regulator